MKELKIGKTKYVGILEGISVELYRETEDKFILRGDKDGIKKGISFDKSHIEEMNDTWNFDLLSYIEHTLINEYK
jgi:hypothetical protein